MTRHGCRLTCLALALALVAMPVVASDDEFALAFPVDAPTEAPVFAIDLPAEAYATLTTTDLSDLLVVDAQGREQPISLHLPSPPAPPPLPQVVDLPLPIEVPGDSASMPGGLELHVRRDADGGLASLDLNSTEGRDTAALPAEWLIDVGDASRDGIDGLRLMPRDDSDFRTLVRIRGSDDLVHWQELQSAVPLLRASGDGRRIERLDLSFARTTNRYLALRPVDSNAALPPVAALQGLRRRDAGPMPLVARALEGAARSDDARTIEYGPIGPLPIQQVDVQLAEGDGPLEYQLEEQIGDRWQTVATGTAWRLSIAGETLEAGPVPLWRTGSGRLRLRLPQPAPAPRLVLGYAPHRIIVMPNGTPPYRLLAGSVHRTRSTAALDDPLEAIRQRQGEAWQPPLAVLRPAQTLGGTAALTPQPDVGRWALWAVLGLGALAVGGLAWRLLGATGPAD